MNVAGSVVLKVGINSEAETSPFAEEVSILRMRVGRYSVEVYYSEQLENVLETGTDFHIWFACIQSSGALRKFKQSSWMKGWIVFVREASVSDVVADNLSELQLFQKWNTVENQSFHVPCEVRLYVLVCHELKGVHRVECLSSV